MYTISYCMRLYQCPLLCSYTGSMFNLCNTLNIGLSKNEYTIQYAHRLKLVKLFSIYCIHVHSR